MNQFAVSLWDSRADGAERKLSSVLTRTQLFERRHQITGAIVVPGRFATRVQKLNGIDK